MITKKLKMATAGLVGLLSLSGVSSCKKTEVRQGDYNRMVDMPTECQEVISAGCSQSYFYGRIISWDYLSCKDQQGNVTIYRMNKGDTVWYKTEIRKIH